MNLYYRIWFKATALHWAMEPGIYRGASKAVEPAQRLANKLQVETSIVEHNPLNNKHRKTVYTFTPEPNKEEA